MPSAVLRDEGDHGPGGGWAVSPSFPLLATMLAGTWLGWAWFAWNAHALASDRLLAQLRLLLVGLVGASVIAIGLDRLLAFEVLSHSAFDYCVIALVAWKLWISYKLSTEQRLESQLFQYYGGQLRDGRGVVVAGVFLRGSVLGALPYGWWTLVLQ